MRLLIPDCQKLISAVLERSPSRQSPLHGVHHWRCVAWAGCELAREVAGCDPAVVFLFAVFHDSMRHNDGGDPEHGRRGSELAKSMQGGLLQLSSGQMGLLEEACQRHTYGEATADPTLGVCWDADRLNLWRVGVAPDSSRLSTAAARSQQRIHWAMGLPGGHLDWGVIYAAFCELR